MIRLSNVNKYYNKRKPNELHVINGFSAELPESGLVAIFGRSGCGKTTLLNVIGGLDSIDSGSIAFNGVNISKDENVYRNKYVGYIFQNYNLSKQETVYENVADALRLCGIDDKATIDKHVINALVNVGLEKFRNRFPDALSGGQQQRVAIARALVKNPSIILADEPTGNLDEANTIMIMDILKEISKTRLVLLVTHEANLVDYYCDKVIEMHDGRINSERVNSDANGYNERNKNDIYLGELEKREVSENNLHIDLYGELPFETLSLTIVNLNGRLFLKSSDPSIKLLDASSEIKLKEGVFEEKRAQEKKTEFTSLPLIHGKAYGRLFDFKNSVISGYRANIKKAKKSKSFLKTVLTFFSIIMVITAVIIGGIIDNMMKVDEEAGESFFYVKGDKSQVLSAIGLLNDKDSGVDDYGVFTPFMYGSSDDYGISAYVREVEYGKESVRIDLGQFESSNVYVESVNIRAVVLKKSVAKDYKVVQGSLSDKENGLVITTAIADNIIENATVSYINSYDDLIGLNCINYRQMEDGSNIFSLNGIVESSELIAFFNDSVIDYNRIANDDIKNDNVVMLHSNDVSKTDAKLKEQNLEYLSPKDVRESILSQYRSSLLQNGVEALIVLALMAVCMYFIMRSALMSRIKEIGIYRAVGVSKKNILYKFTIESLVLTTLTVFIGYLITSIGVWFVESTSKTLALQIYYPVWLSLAVLIVIYAICTVCGTLPIMMMNRKTPSAILAKYDI